MSCIKLITLFFAFIASCELIGQEKVEYAIAVHGGAGLAPSQFSVEANNSRRNAMRKALKIGTEILKNGGSSLDAVEQVVLFLEDNPQFNAGVGAVFNAAGSHELDASIMEGKEKACGAVAGVSTVKNPIALARLVMTNTRHVLLVGAGAEKFAEKMKVGIVKPDHFDTKKTKESWRKRVQQKKHIKGAKSEKERSSLIQKINMTDQDIGSYQGTVGCVALDKNGNLAAATSTGGLTGKQFGRIGDSPIVGAGTYADNQTCAVSGTGIGKQFIRNSVAYDVSARMKYKGESVDQALNHILSNTLNEGDGGLIAVSAGGEISMRFNTPGMARAAADSLGRFEVLWDGKE